MKTITGKPLFEAFKELNKQLDSNAYKEITGGKGGKLGLTDIKPAYLPEQLLELFGPYGYGWGFELLDMNTKARTVKRSAGYEEEEYVTTCKIGAWYRFEVDGVIHKSDLMIGTGGSDNTQIEWAEKGALTSAIGTAWFFAGYQLDVYKGLRSHKKTSGGTKQETKTTTETQTTSTEHKPLSEDQAKYFPQIKVALDKMYGADIEKKKTLIKRLTAFTNKDGKEIPGIEDYRKKDGQWLKILCKNIEKMAADMDKDLPVMCEYCQKTDGTHEEGCPERF